MTLKKYRHLRIGQKCQRNFWNLIKIYVTFFFHTNVRDVIVIDK